MGTDSHRKPVCCPASPPLPALLCAGVPAADADFKLHPLAVGYLLKCYKFHKQGFGEAWDKGMHEAFALTEKRQAGQAAFPPEGSANYILMELWMIWNMVPYLWYRW